MYCTRCHYGSDSCQFRRGDLANIKAALPATNADGKRFFKTVIVQKIEYICPHCGERSVSHLYEVPFKTKIGTQRPKRRDELDEALAPLPAALTTKVS